uniref:Conserved oligomeric Golgi complex subunit 5 n=1 Tax=Trypanosoma congolense (strain IL3000) TaxID=1068625 RepID=G0V3E2_TRYCI|nr:unnamed protein product [Trypanosoma congolense IL3000]
MFTDNMLMTPDFDEEGYLRYALHASNCKAEQSRLAACSAAVRENVHNILSENVEDMLQQLSAASQAQRGVAAARQAAATLMHSTSRLRHTIQEPYRLISANVTKLRNANAAINTLQCVMKFVGLTTRLRSLLPDDIAHAARTLREVEDLLQTSDIKGIDVVRRRIDIVEKAAAVVRAKAHDLLRHASAQNVSDVATALQCFLAMGSTSRVLGGFMTEQKREVMKSLMRELEVQVILDEVSRECSRVSDTSEVTERTREIILSHLQTALKCTAKYTNVVVVVWQVVARRTDPITQTPYLSAVENPTSFLGDYWHFITDKLLERLQALHKQPNLFAAMATDALRYRLLFTSFLADVRELLELIEQLTELDTLCARQGNLVGGGANHCGVEQLRRMWLLQMTNEVSERFAGQIMDRHRERMHDIISKLHSIVPSAGNRPLPNLSVDLQRPQIPAAVHVLDVRGYVTLAMRDVVEYQKDPQTLSAVLNCILQCVRLFLLAVPEATRRCALPPLPSVAAEVTAAQMLHICICNACAILSMDLTVLLASLPNDDSNDRTNLTEELVDARRLSNAAGEVARGTTAEEPTLSARGIVVDKHRELLDIAVKLKNISEETVKPFFKSASVLLLDSISMCIDGLYGQEAAGVSQLQSQMRHFMSHFYYLFNPQTPTLDDSVRQLTDSLIARLLVAASLVHPFTKDLQQHLIICLHQIPRVVLSFGPNTHGTVGRSTIVLKGQVHQLLTWYKLSSESLESPVEGVCATLATLPPVIARLLLLQRVACSSSTVWSPPAVLGMQTGAFIEIVESTVLEGLRADLSPVDEPVRRVADSAPMAARIAEIMGVIEKCFHEATEFPDQDATRASTVSCMKCLWTQLKQE